MSIDQDTIEEFDARKEQLTSGVRRLNRKHAHLQRYNSTELGLSPCP